MRLSSTPYFTPPNTRSRLSQASRPQSVQFQTFGANTTNTLLFVDDNRGDHTLFKELVAKELKDTTVQYAFNPAAALDIIKQGGITHLVTDVDMGARSGLWLVEQINNLSESALIPDTIIVNSNREANRSKAVGLGATFLKKPDFDGYAESYTSLLGIETKS